jgi:hypothetical protein
MWQAKGSVKEKIEMDLKSSKTKNKKQIRLANGEAEYTSGRAAATQPLSWRLPLKRRAWNNHLHLRTTAIDNGHTVLRRANDCSSLQLGRAARPAYVKLGHIVLIGVGVGRPPRAANLHRPSWRRLIEEHISWRVGSAHEGNVLHVKGQNKVLPQHTLR